MPGRTIGRWIRTYIDGVDWSPYIIGASEMGWSYDAPLFHAQSDEGNGGLPDMPTVSLGDMQAVLFTATPSGFHNQASAVPETRTVMIPWGIQQAPVLGDYVFSYPFIQSNYIKAIDKGMSMVNMHFALPAIAYGMTYIRPWGNLLHPKGTETAVNSAVYWDSSYAATAFGGYMCYQLFTSNGTVALKVQDSAAAGAGTGADLAGCTTGDIDATTTPKFGFIQIGKTATVRQFLRWQLVFNTATTANFALSFTRALRDGE